IGCGLLIFIGALLNWRWGCEYDHRWERPYAFDTLVHDFFGDQGYRFLMGISGLVIILCGLVFLFLS
ncbi:Imm17 family immunity protein, partial [Phascolarctobacterium faecium]|uniref:Imm17 family immunity protein n=1 Tax=Phascolarctobacterium faecium TaxID=33025 RepID=UPI0040257A6D